MNTLNPEVGRSIDVGGIQTNYHDVGEGVPIVLLHGSGPGVTAWANWQFTVPVLARTHRVIAVDLLGFGYTDPARNRLYTKQTWQRHITAFLDTLGLDKVSLVGNSFGGGMAIALAAAQPDRIDKMVLMGSAGLEFPVTDALATVWGYRPSLENMRDVMDAFAFDRTLIRDDLIEMRYRASIRPGISEAFADMFADNQQEKMREISTSEEMVARIPHETLIVHGREDRVVPLEVAMRTHQLIKNSQLHVFGQCGHWTQIEKRDRFNQLVSNFFQKAE